MEKLRSNGKNVHTRRSKWTVMSVCSIIVLLTIHLYKDFSLSKLSQAISPYSFPAQPDFSIKDNHNIDINPLLREPTMHPNASAILRTGHKGALSSDLEFCNQLVYDKIITRYGMDFVNSADIAVSLGLCIGMINFFNSGIGGGGYAVFTDSLSSKDNAYFDFRETCPLAWDNRVHKLAKVGGISIGVPGELMGLYQLHESKGLNKVTWAQLLEPIIELGHNGWIMESVLSAAISKYESFFVENYQDWKFLFNSDEKFDKTSLKKQGDLIKRPALANMLQELANNGSVAPFYDPNHWIVQSMSGKIKESQGIITPLDFSQYKVMQGKPLETVINKNDDAYWDTLTVQTAGGSSSGAALIAGLKIMDKFPYRKGGDYFPESSFELIESMKWMASSRSRLGDYYNETGDADIYPERILEVLSDEWCKNSTGKMSGNYLKTFNDYKEYYPEYEMNEPHGTAHFSILDSHNTAVSLTTTINLLFGSLVHDPITGVIFNNEMDDFSDPSGESNAFDLKPSVYNIPEPGKRPLSSTVPTIVIDHWGRPDFVIGASGGSRILTSVFQTIVRNYWYSMPLLESIAYPRVHHQLLPNRLEVESKSMIGSKSIEAMAKMGYSEIKETPPQSVVNAIKRDHRNLLHAVSDYWRKRGISVAY